MVGDPLIEAPVKLCNKCGLWKSLPEFIRSSRCLSGYTSPCKVCRKAYMQANKARYAHHSRNYHRRNRAADLARMRLFKYGLTDQDYATLMTQQASGCAICHVPFAESVRHTDHDHATGRVRGLLCENCNRGIGMFQDDPQRLLAAVDYLMKSFDPDLNPNQPLTKQDKAELKQVFGGAGGTTHGG